MQSTQTLRSAAQTRNILIGAGVDEASFESQRYRDFLAKEFNCLYPTWALKWDGCHYEKGKFDFAIADRIVDFALESGCKIRLNCLLWHRDIPEWVLESALSKAAAWEVVAEHIETVLKHFRGRIHYCDVVNEAIGDSGPARDVGWGPLLGNNWIEEAFRLAHNAAPEVELFYCDYRPKAEAKWDTIQSLLSKALSNGAPIHGLAVQLHSRMVPAVSERQVTSLLSKFLPLPLRIHLPECGVWIPPNGWLKDRQALIYGGMVRAGIKAGVDEIGFWWPTDWRAKGKTWVDFQSKPALPGLYDRALNPKPARDSVILALNQQQIQRAQSGSNL